MGVLEPAFGSWLGPVSSVSLGRWIHLLGFRFLVHKMGVRRSLGRLEGSLLSVSRTCWCVEGPPGKRLPASSGTVW